MSFLLVLKLLCYHESVYICNVINQDQSQLHYYIKDASKRKGCLNRNLAYKTEEYKYFISVKQSFPKSTALSCHLSSVKTVSFEMLFQFL